MIKLLLTTIVLSLAAVSQAQDIPGPNPLKKHYRVDVALDAVSGVQGAAAVLSDLTNGVYANWCGILPSITSSKLLEDGLRLTVQVTFRGRGCSTSETRWALEDQLIETWGAKGYKALLLPSPLPSIGVEG